MVILVANAKWLRELLAKHPYVDYKVIDLIRERNKRLSKKEKWYS